MAKKRLDVLMVEKGLVESRQKAQAIIMAGAIPLKKAAAAINTPKNSALTMP